MPKSDSQARANAMSLSSRLRSGYPHPLYDDALADWRRVERVALADGAKPRTEVLWMNYDPPMTDRSARQAEPLEKIELLEPTP